MNHEELIADAENEFVNSSDGCSVETQRKLIDALEAQASQIKALTAQLAMAEQDNGDWKAEIKALREALERIEGHKPIFDYCQSPDFDMPGSPYDRGRAAETEVLAGIARKALGETP